MKKLLLVLFFMGITFAGFAQYGKLEPLLPGDQANFVLRTAPDVLKKLEDSSDNNMVLLGKTIRQTEKQLEVSRNGFIARSVPTPNITAFRNRIKTLERLGLDTKYYLQEYFTYYPRNSSR